MINLVDADLEEDIGHCWRNSAGYYVFSQKGKSRLNQQYRRAMKQNTQISWLSQEGRGL